MILISKASETIIAFHKIAFTCGNLCTIQKILVSVPSDIKQRSFLSSGQVDSPLSPLKRGLRVRK